MDSQKKVLNVKRACHTAEHLCHRERERERERERDRESMSVLQFDMLLLIQIHMQLILYTRGSQSLH